MKRSAAIALVAALLLANLGYWAWRSWHAPPAHGSVPWRAPGAKDARPAPATPGIATVRLAGEAAEPTVAAAQVGAAEPAASTTPGEATPAASAACFEVGPFTALADSDAALGSLRQRGHAPRLAYAAGVAPQRFLVRIDGLPTAADQARVLARLRAAGLADVAALPAGRAISLGLFGEPTRAQARLDEARAAGFAPQVAPQYAPDAEHWLRVDLDPAILPPGATPARALAGAWRVQPCPPPPVAAPPPPSAGAVSAAPAGAAP